MILSIKEFWTEPGLKYCKNVLTHTKKEIMLLGEIKSETKLLCIIYTE
jgi:hypothetical protein